MCFSFLQTVLNAFWRKRWGVGRSRAEFQVERQRGRGQREGAREGRRALPARRYKRCSVFAGERERDEGKGGHCLT